MRKILSIFLLTIPLSAQASSYRPGGYEQGNGGFFVSCAPESPIGKGIFSVDHIEGQLLYKFEPTPSVIHMKSEVDIVHYVLKKLTKVNPSRASLYKFWLQEMLSSQEFVEHSTFSPLPDSSTTLVPTNCTLNQAAIFITAPGSRKPRFLFDKQLWSQALPLEKAYLLMHELIYREAVLPENMHKNSVAARYFNAWLMAHADQLQDRQEEMTELLQDLRFKRTDYNGIGLSLNSRRIPGNSTELNFSPFSRFKNSNKIRKAPLADTFSIRIGNEIFNRICNDSFTSLGFSSYVEFYRSGKVKTLHFNLSDGYTQAINTPGYVGTNCTFHGANYLEFDELGNLTKTATIELLPDQNYDDE